MNVFVYFNMKFTEKGCGIKDYSGAVSWRYQDAWSWDFHYPYKR